MAKRLSYMQGQSYKKTQTNARQYEKYLPENNQENVDYFSPSENRPAQSQIPSVSLKSTTFDEKTAVELYLKADKTEKLDKDAVTYESNVHFLIQDKIIQDGKLTGITQISSVKKPSDDFLLEQNRFIVFKDLSLDHCLQFFTNVTNSQDGSLQEDFRFNAKFYEPNNLLFFYCDKKVVFCIPFDCQLTQDVKPKSGQTFNYDFNEQIYQIDIGEFPLFLKDEKFETFKNSLMVVIIFINSIEIWSLKLEKKSIKFEATPYSVKNLKASYVKVSKFGRIFYCEPGKKQVSEVNFTKQSDKGL